MGAQVGPVRHWTRGESNRMLGRVAGRSDRDGGVR